MNLKNYWHHFKQRRLQKLPLVTTPYRAELERKQKQYFIGFVLLLIFLGWYSYRYIQHQALQIKPVKVVAAKTDLAAPHKLSFTDLKVIEMPQKWVPISTWQDPSALVGQTLRRRLEANEVIVVADVQKHLDPNSITAQFKENLAFALGEDWLSAKLPNLKKTDKIDVLAANPKAGLEGTTTVASSLTVVAVEKSGGRKNLVLNVTPQQAQSLLFTRSLRLPMQVVIHSAHTQEEPKELIKTPTENKDTPKTPSLKFES